MASLRVLDRGMYAPLRKARTFLAQPYFLQLWTLPVWALLGLARLAIISVSFRKLAPLLGNPRGIDPWTPLLTEHQQHRALEIGRTIRTVACYTPWDSNCFAQAVVARILLGLHRIPYIIYFGLAPLNSPSSSRAHAWVTSGRTRVTGGESFGQFVIVGMYVSKKLARAE